jgi:radical SAM superfamily enzyme YgiQ (UPF0313 family)
MNQSEPNLKAKVVFVEPRGAHSNVFAKFMTIPMLGPLYLGTIAEKEGYDVCILNENILGRKILPSELMGVDILCLSCMTTTVERGKQIAKEYKELRKSNGLPARTIIGGIHASMIPEDVQDDFDQVFVGEAESKILDILSGKITDKLITGIKTENLDSVPIANFKLIKNWEKMTVWPIMTSRGCPYDCNFCSVTEMFGRKYRTKSIERVIEEIKAYNQKNFFFVDDHFVVNKNRTRQFLSSLQQNELDIRWTCQLRADVAKDRALISQMRGQGCRTVYVGFESINPESLKEMKKGQTVADIRQSIKVFRENSIKVHGMFMLGNDSDRKGIFRSTSDFCRKSGLASVQYLIITPLPGTEFYKKIEGEGRLLHKNWEFYDALHVVFLPKNFTPWELQQGIIDCFGEFYSYTSAFLDALNVFFEIPLTLIKRIYKNVQLPSLTNSLWKIVGKKIVKNWIKFNKPYLNYLNKTVQSCKEIQ